MLTKSLVFFWPDGCFENVHWIKEPGQISLYFSRRGFQTTIVVSFMNATNIPEKIEIIELLKGKFKQIFQKNESKLKWEVIYLLNFPKVLSYLVEKKPDLLIVEHRTSLITLFALLLYRRHLKKNDRTRMVLRYDLDPDMRVGILFRLTNRLVLNVFDIVIAETKCAYDMLWNIKQSSKIKMVPNGYWCHQAVINNSDREKAILSVGRVVSQKGHDILIKSFAKVHSLHQDWFLKIAGPIEDKQYYDELRDMVENLGLTEYVRFLGSMSQSELEREYKSASIFCLLSRSESFGIARVEAMSYGLPAIITDAGCGMEYEKYGTIVVPVEDVDKAAKAMLRLIEDPALREKISRQQLDGILSWGEVGEEIYKIAFST